LIFCPEFPSTMFNRIAAQYQRLYHDGSTM
jgi:hypothetical protein